MYSRGALVICLLICIQNVLCLPIGMQNPMNTLNNFNCVNQQLLPEVMPSGAPVITEIVPSLQFGDITCTGDLPIQGTIRVKGSFPVYGTVAVDGGLPSSGTAVVNTGCVNAQIV